MLKIGVYIVAKIWRYVVLCHVQSIKVSQPMMNCLGVQLKWNYLRQKQSDISGIYSGKRRIAYGSYGRFSFDDLPFEKQQQLMFHSSSSVELPEDSSWQNEDSPTHRLMDDINSIKFVYIPWKMVGCGTSTHASIDDIILDKCLDKPSLECSSMMTIWLWHSQFANWKERSSMLFSER